MKRKFFGSTQQMRDAVLMTGVYGEWVRLEATGGYQFRAGSGAILNWWPTTKTYNLQGNPRDAAVFEGLLEPELAKVRMKKREGPEGVETGENAW